MTTKTTAETASSTLMRAAFAWRDIEFRVRMAGGTLLDHLADDYWYARRRLADELGLERVPGHPDGLALCRAWHWLLDDLASHERFDEATAATAATGFWIRLSETLPMTL